MLQIIETINTAVNNFIWGVPAMVCIFGVGLYLSIRTNFLQIRKFPYAIKTTLDVFSANVTHLTVLSRLSRQCVQHLQPRSVLAILPV